MAGGNIDSSLSNKYSQEYSYTHSHDVHIQTLFQIHSSFDSLVFMYNFISYIQWCPSEQDRLQSTLSACLRPASSSCFFSSPSEFKLKQPDHDIIQISSRLVQSERTDFLPILKGSHGSYVLCWCAVNLCLLIRLRWTRRG